MFEQKKLQLFLIIGFYVLFISACGWFGSEENLPDAGEITVYTAIAVEEARGYLEAFQAEYPQIEVNLVNDTTGNITRRLFEEQDDPQADVIWGVAATSVILAEWNDLLEPYEPAGLERVDPQFRGP